MKRPKDSIYSMASPGYLREIGVFDEMVIKEIDRFRRIRNMLVHGSEIPSSESLIKEGRSLEKLTKKLKNLLQS